MKTSTRSIITLGIALILCVTIALFAAGCEKPSEATLNGAHIEEYVIVYSADGLDYNKNAALYIQESIEAVTGVKLDIVTDDAAEQANEIIVGETSRALSAALDADIEGLEFAVLADGTCIALEAEYFVIAGAAYYFVDTYVTDRDFVSVVPEELTVREPAVESPKNFIFLIGDGMGVYQTKLFDYLPIPEKTTTDGEDFFYGYMLPYRGESITNSLSEGATDSAAGGTALASGYKTYNEYIGKDKDLNDVMSLTELADSLGMATAVMSTENVTGATPASFSAHAFDRDNSNDIRASQALLKNTIIECATDTFIDSTSRSIISRVLNEVSADEDGFFLMYEEAYIDKSCHNNDMERTFRCLLRFNQAIGMFMEFALYHPDTLVIITADHETGDLRPEDDGKLHYHLDDHSTANVPVFAYGVGAEIFNGKTFENVQIPKTIAAMWGVNDFGDTSSPYGALQSN